MMKKLLALFVLFVIASLSFAAGGCSTSSGSWQGLALLAIIASLLALGLIYAVGYALDSNELKFLAREELVQLVFTGLLVASFAIVVSTLCSFQDYTADAINFIEVSKSNLITLNNEIGEVAKDIGEQGSKSVWCSFSATGYGVSTCSGYRMLGPPLSLGFQLTATAISELNAMQFLIKFSQDYVFTFLFPLGLFLRTFKYTRGAGNMLIAIAVALYIFLPLGFYFTHKTVYDWAQPGIPSMQGYVQQCDAFDLKGTSNERAILDTFSKMTENQPDGWNLTKKLLFYTLLDATMSTVISLAIMAISIRYIMAIGGAEIDTQSLARLI